MERLKLIRDSIHGFVSLPRFYVHLIDSPEFQRLRRLHQLGTSAVTYPCAEHSRFQHSLGVAHVFQRMAEVFRLQGGALTEEEMCVGLCAALLHDIGHGPFSHALEGVIVPNKRHEYWSQEIILSDTTVNKRLRAIDESLPEKVASVIAKKPGYGIVVQMISSQLDADRMDYLLRDSQCAGVQYGKYDVERLVRMLVREGSEIRVDYRAKMNVEEYLFARYHMYWQVYFHKTTRGAECLLKAAWTRAQDLCAQGKLPLDGVSRTLKEALRQARGSFQPFPMGVYLALDDSDVLVALKEWCTCDDPILSDLSRRFIERDLLKPVDLPRDRSNWGLETLVKRVVESRGFAPDFYALVDSCSAVAYDYYVADEGESEKPAIVLLDKSGKKEEISRSSPAVQAIARREIRMTLYVPEECRAEVQKIVSGGS